MEKKKSAKKVKQRKHVKGKKNPKLIKIIRRLFRRYKMYFAAGFVVLVLLLVLILGIRGCGVNHKNPEAVVKDLIESYKDGKQKRIRDCYGVKEADENLQNEIDATIRYFEVHNVQKVEIDDCGVISKDENHTYVYIIYSLILENEQRYPIISTYMTEYRNEGYYVLPPSKVSDEMSMWAAEEYNVFMSTDPYKDYITAYDTFIKKNPGYEERIAGKLS